MAGPNVWIVGSQRLELRIPLMQWLSRRGFRMAAVGQHPCPQMVEAGFEYYQYPLRRTHNPLADRRAVQVLRKLFAERSPDIVHAVNTKPCLLAPRAARLAGVPGCVRTITGLGALFSSESGLQQPLQLAYRVLQRRAAQRSQITVFQNPDDREYFLSHRLVDAESAELILGSGIDVEAFRNRRADARTLRRMRVERDLAGRRVVTMIARLIRPKGILEFVDAARILQPEFPDTVFLLAGGAMTEGPLSIPLRIVAGPDSPIRFIGPTDDVPNLLALSDVFVLPTYFREGIPRVLMEAAAMRLPVITTDMPGCREVVDEGQNGFLIPPRDAQSLADRLRLLLRSPELCRQMGEHSIRLVRDKLHLDRVAAAYEQVYQRVWAATRVDLQRAA
jgi:glycosyltransferase involved in cell wall biosynthesis